VKSWVKKNISEKELSDLLEMELRKNGAYKSSFDIIVAKGESSAFPHAVPRRDRIIDVKRDFLLVDCGANFNGYNSDLTAMFFFAKIPKDIRRFHFLVKEAKDIARRCIKVGVNISFVHRQVKSFFKKEGALKYFLHNTGHGVGIDVHESPFIGEESKEVFEENMVITIEPGLYKKDLGGVRLEDMFLVKSDGVKILS
jgi:Xaa-Pro aminopeptidase